MSRKKIGAAPFLRFLATAVLACSSLSLRTTAQQTTPLSIDASKLGAKIDRNLFGQFAENLGHGLYGGIWVGLDSPIPNTRGIRNDVVDANSRSEGAGRSLAGRMLRRPISLAQWDRPCRQATCDRKLGVGRCDRHERIRYR